VFRYLESHSGQVTTETQPYARLNTFSMFGAYSWISSHMFLGYAQNRQLLNIGVAYGPRLLTNRVVNRQYNAELIPVALESDPLVHSVISQQTPTVETYRLPPVECLCSEVGRLLQHGPGRDDIQWHCDPHV